MDCRKVLFFTSLKRSGKPKNVNIFEVGGESLRQVGFPCCLPPKNLKKKSLRFTAIFFKVERMNAGIIKWDPFWGYQTMQMYLAILRVCDLFRTVSSRDPFKGCWWPPFFGDKKVTAWITWYGCFEEFPLHSALVWVDNIMTPRMVHLFDQRFSDTRIRDEFWPSPQLAIFGRTHVLPGNSAIVTFLGWWFVTLLERWKVTSNDRGSLKVTAAESPGRWWFPIFFKNIFYVHPYLGKWSNLTHIFRHQQWCAWEW